MLIAILAGAEMKAELLTRGFHDDVEIVWVDSLSSLAMADAECYIDLKYEMDVERNQKLSRFSKPVIVGAVNNSLSAIGDDRFIRINSWPGMINRQLVELAFNDIRQPNIGQLIEKIGWQYIKAPDIPGFITNRIIATIVNEAYFALGEEVSDKPAIDLAMKTGTNYPYGPFEWSEKIGLTEILALLKSMHAENAKYVPAPALLNEIAAQR